jgi:hypothetical protein
MNFTWALVTTSKKLVFADSEYRKLKIIQLLMSSSTLFDVVAWRDNVVIQPEQLELHHKVAFVKSIFDSEEANIANLSIIRNNDGLKDTLKSVREFYTLIHPKDTIVPDLVDQELTELDGWMGAVPQHKSYIFQALHKLDYLQDLDTIKQEFRDTTKNPPHDDYYVYEQLNHALMTFLNSTS